MGEMWSRYIVSPPTCPPVLIFGRDVDGKIGHVSPILDKPSLQSLFTRPSTDGTFGFALSSCDSDISICQKEPVVPFGHVRVRVRVPSE